MRATGGRLAALAVGLPFVVAAASYGAFSMVGLFAHGSERHVASYQWQGGAIDLNTGSGTITVETGTGTQVAVTYTEHYQLKKPTVTSSVSASGLQLTAKCPGGLFTSNCAINYVLTVPATATLKLHTGDGAISGTQVSSKNVQASTGDGSIRIDWSAAPTTVVTTTGDGSVHLVLPQGSGPYRTSTHTGNGSVHVTALVDSTAAASITAETGNGGITIGYPSSG
jgi:hypothetical protein